MVKRPYEKGERGSIPFKPQHVFSGLLAKIGAGSACSNFLK
jgi:hypothetical protein